MAPWVDQLDLTGGFLVAPAAVVFDGRPSDREPEGVQVQPRSEPPWPASDPWAIDVPLELAGYRLSLLSAQLEEVNGTTLLALLPAVPKDGTSAPRLTGLRPRSIVAPDGRPLELVHALRFGYRGTVIDVADPETGSVLPGRYHLELAGATVALAGPWEMSWNLREP